MSVRIMTFAWDIACKTHTQKLVLIALADNSNDQGSCWPSLVHLTKKCDLSRQGVIDQIESIVESGILKVEKSKGKVNKYQFNLELFDQSTPLTTRKTSLVNHVDYHQSTPQTGVVNAIDPNHQEPSIEPPVITSTRERATKFLTQWQGAFYEAFGYRCVVRKADEKTVAAILLCGISETELLDIAKRAWKAKDKFWCQKSVSLATFCARLDEIRNEINKTHNSRNGSTAPAVTDYAAAAKRKAA